MKLLCWSNGADGGRGGRVCIKFHTNCVIGDREESLCDCCLCENGMFLDDGVIGNMNSKLSISNPIEDPAFFWDFCTIHNVISIHVHLESFTISIGWLTQYAKLTKNAKLKL